MLLKGEHIDRFSHVGRVVAEVAYGKRILETIGEDLYSWNIQLLHLIDEALVRFWFVDVFNFRASLLSLSLSFIHRYTQFASYPAGSLEPDLGSF